MSQATDRMELNLNVAMGLDPVTICACVTWIAMHCHDVKPEYLAGEMAAAMLRNVDAAAQVDLAEHTR